MGTTTLMSFAEFEQLPSCPEQLELLKGELIQSPPPERHHMVSFHDLYGELAVWHKSNPHAEFGDVFMEMGYLLPTDPASWLRPDVSVAYRNQPGDRYFERAPLIAFEVVSEFNTAAQLQSKVRLYLENGAKEVWVLYPVTREAWVYREYNHPTLEQDAIHSNLLPGLSIPLPAVFGAATRS
jgi:Uma2 family endonuclease